MSEPEWMPSYRIELWEGGFKNRRLETVAANADREVDALAEARAHLESAWKPGPRKGRRARPLVAVVIRALSGQEEEVGRLRWTIDGVA